MSKYMMRRFMMRGIMRMQWVGRYMRKQWKRHQSIWLMVVCILVQDSEQRTRSTHLHTSAIHLHTGAMHLYTSATHLRTGGIHPRT